MCALSLQGTLHASLVHRLARAIQHASVQLMVVSSHACTGIFLTRLRHNPAMHAMLQAAQSGATPPCAWHALPCQCNAVQTHGCTWHQLQLRGSQGLPCPRPDVCKRPPVANHDMTVYTQSVQRHIGGALQHARYLDTQASCCRPLYI